MDEKNPKPVKKVIGSMKDAIKNFVPPASLSSPSKTVRQQNTATPPVSPSRVAMPSSDARANMRTIW